MQIPLRYAEDIIGGSGDNIEFIRARSGANILILEGGRFDEIVVEIRGTPTQVQTAQQLIEVFYVFNNLIICFHHHPCLFHDNDASYGTQFSSKYSVRELWIPVNIHFDVQGLAIQCTRPNSELGVRRLILFLFQFFLKCFNYKFSSVNGCYSGFNSGA